jgi:hypothetical protein
MTAQDENEMNGCISVGGTADITETLQTIQTLLLRMIGRADSTFQMQSVSLELLQEAVVEARSGRTSLWQFLIAPVLKEKGRDAEEVARLFDVQSEDAKNFAYSLAEEIKKELDADDLDSSSTHDEDRQGTFVYEPADTSGNGGPT